MKRSGDLGVMVMEISSQLIASQTDHYEAYDNLLVQAERSVQKNKNQNADSETSSLEKKPINLLKKGIESFFRSVHHSKSISAT